MKVSFVIPLFNCQDYIIKCLESIVSINYKDYEIIVVNDGSTDDSQKKVEEFIKKYKHIKLYNKHNEGLSITRNFGIEKAKGDYLFFVDADDMLLAKRVDEIINICKLNKYDIIAGTYVYLENNEFKDAPFKLSNNINNDLNYLLTLHNYTAEAVKFIIKKQFLVNTNITFKPNILHEDELYTPQILTAVNEKKIKIFNKPFYIYRKHSNTITTKKNIKKSYDSLFICSQLYKLSNDFKDKNKIKYDYLIRRANLMYVSVCTSLNQFNNSDQTSIILELKSLYANFSKNTNTIKDKSAALIIKLFGYKIFCYIQKLRNK